MLIAGANLLAVAAGILLVARSHRAKARAARLTETLSCGDIASLAGGVGAEVGGDPHGAAAAIGVVLVVTGLLA